VLVLVHATLGVRPATLAKVGGPDSQGRMDQGGGQLMVNMVKLRLTLPDQECLESIIGSAPV
jgi:hypothetical protein